MKKLKHSLYSFLVCAVILFLSLSAQNQEAPSPVFKRAATGYSWSFPRDHGAHPDYQTEWWYFTGHLENAEGRKFGFQWTVFRRALQPESKADPTKPAEKKSAWRTNQIYLGHLAISDLQEKKFYFGESIQRAVLNLAGASEKTLQVWLPNFQADLQEANVLTLQASQSENSPRFGLKLKLELPPQPVLHGQNGFSAKSAPDEKGQLHGSYYYSYTHLPTEGVLEIADKKYLVKGQAWMDHEFSSSTLTPTQIGWDWLSLPLRNQSALMLFRVRDARGADYDYYSGSFIDAQGIRHSLNSSQIQWLPKKTWKSPQSGAKYPIEWNLKIPDYNLEVQLKAQFPEQEFLAQKSGQVIYWEGSLQAEVRHQDQNYSTDAYLEMTGYAGSFEQRI